MTHEDETQRRKHERFAGPNPGIVAAVFTAVFIASLVPVTMLAGGGTHFPSPFQPTEEVVAYFRNEPDKVRVCAFLQFAAAVPLGIYAAAMVSLLLALRVRAVGLQIAWFGGVAASISMSMAAFGQWAVGQPGIAEDAALTRALHYFLFAVGGPGYTVPFGLLVAGIAVPGLLLRLLPRWLAVAGIALGVVGELSALSLIIPTALFLVPLTRFPGFAWLIAAGFALARSSARAYDGCRVVRDGATVEHERAEHT
jgi:hypothetical protein